MIACLRWRRSRTTTPASAAPATAPARSPLLRLPVAFTDGYFPAGRAHRRAGAAGGVAAHATEAAVGERADAHAVPRVQPVEQREQRRDALVGLGVDVDPRV